MTRSPLRNEAAKEQASCSENVGIRRSNLDTFFAIWSFPDNVRDFFIKETYLIRESSILQ